MPRLIAAFVVVCAIVSSARAQIIYEPVRYQYGGQTPYYYGGSDPDVFRFAAREYGEAHNGFTSATADTMSFREVTSLRPRVYVDHIRRGDASIYGYTAVDARNDAYWNAARYFNKHDIIAKGVVDETGALHVSPQAASDRPGSIEIKPYVHPATVPTRVFIFPKDLLDKKLGEENKTVATAQ